MNLNKALNVVAWIVFIISIISYITGTFEFEAIYFATSAIFLVIAPRHVAESFN